MNCGLAPLAEALQVEKPPFPQQCGLGSPASYKVDQRQELQGGNRLQRKQEATSISLMFTTGSTHQMCLSQRAGS